MGSAYYTDEEIARLKAKCASLTRENERLRERLEVGYYWTSKDGGPLERVPVPESVDIPDGISCRDETIKLQEERITTLTREVERLRAEVRELRMQILSDECQHQENYQRAEAMEHAKNEYATLAYERGREIERLRAVVEAARGLVSFCDDPNGSEKPESLACGLARLLPDMRAALTLPRTEGETET